jgi:hypothetical protein
LAELRVSLSRLLRSWPKSRAFPNRADGHCGFSQALLTGKTGLRNFHRPLRNGRKVVAGAGMTKRLILQQALILKLAVKYIYFLTLISKFNLKLFL